MSCISWYNSCLSWSFTTIHSQPLDLSEIFPALTISSLFAKEHLRCCIQLSQFLYGLCKSIILTEDRLRLFATLQLASSVRYGASLWSGLPIHSEEVNSRRHEVWVAQYPLNCAFGGLHSSHMVMSADSWTGSPHPPYALCLNRQTVRERGHPNSSSRISSSFIASINPPSGVISCDTPNQICRNAPIFHYTMAHNPTPIDNIGFYLSALSPFV